MTRRFVPRPATRILGIDPGTASIGFGVIERGERGRLAPIWHGCLKTSPQESDAARLVRIADACDEILGEFDPAEVAIESLFFGANAQAALTVGQARGVCMVSCARVGVAVHEYAPTAIKQAVTGFGRADKLQVQEMVKILLGLTEIPRPDHAADALAAAICHAGTASVGTSDARVIVER